MVFGLVGCIRRRKKLCIAVTVLVVVVIVISIVLGVTLNKPTKSSLAKGE